MSPTYGTAHARPIVPFAVATGAILLFTTMDGVVKALPHGLPIIQVVAMRYLFGIPLVLLAMWRTGASWPTLSSWKEQPTLIARLPSHHHPFSVAKT